jgi:hypothetical protein
LPEPSEARAVEPSKHFFGPGQPPQARTDGDFSAVLSPPGEGRAPI